MENHGIYACTGILPIDEEGVWLRVHPTMDTEDASTHAGKMVYIPNNTMFLSPATMLHAGGLRTGPRGNPRMHFLFFLVPPEAVSQAESVIPKTFTSTYVGVDEGDQRHDFVVYDRRAKALGTHSSPFYNQLEFLELFAKHLAF